MKRVLAEHEGCTFLKPGEIVFSSKSIIVSTILGSCVSVTMFSPKRKAGAICHAMLPSNNGKARSLNYVDTAVTSIYTKMINCGAGKDMIVKVFGGAQVLGYGDVDGGKSVGKQNILQAQKTLEALQLRFICSDIGGTMGRKLYFSMINGDVFIRKIKLQKVGIFNNGVL
jgi:chemotaxis protein CheD